MRTVLISLMMAIAVAGFAQTSDVAASSPASQVWKIPFASSGNTISLCVGNKSSLEAKNISVTFTN